MRSIGKKNIALVKKMADDLYIGGEHSISIIQDAILCFLPDKILNIWESAEDEIRRVVLDHIYPRTL